MSGYRSFAVAGTGNVGKFIIDALLEKKAIGVISSITVLTRSSEGKNELESKGVKVVAVDYTFPSSLEAALSGIDIVIAALGLHGIEHQVALAASAKTAGVKLFVPSEYGSDPHGQTDHPLFKLKEVAKQKLKELGLPYVVFFAGLFADQALAQGFSVALGFDFVNGVLSIPGTGNPALSWATRADTAKFIVHTLTTLPQSKLEWQTFRIETDRISFNDLAAIWNERQAKAGKPTATITHRPRSQFEEALKKTPNDILPMFWLLLEDGQLVVGRPEGISNFDIPGWSPKRVSDVLQDLYR
ncbi:NAD-binding protein [Fomitiporia mediterranea MF3/22]|uniref:NAD-binding protein n=1 Tax=Fomitiporia mediterranea (strain MF3/22) TaxID=694068 RepID=UPI00044077E9|nr:NAD-binding protein [Fomitiporia mediterranea MF3/22]EJD05394.1 NAD-binding protein [Fomitiporia mediterranea MF3/22]